MTGEVDSTTPTKKRRPGQKPEHDWAPAFIDNFRKLGVVAAACDAAGIHRSRSYARRKTDPAFAEAWAAAEDDAADVLEQVAQGWATTGLPERVQETRTTVDEDGKVISSTTTVRDSRTRSPFLLGLLLKARRPERFRERYEVRTEATPVTYDFSRLTPDELDVVYSKLAKAAVDVELDSINT